MYRLYFACVNFFLHCHSLHMILHFFITVCPAAISPTMIIIITNPDPSDRPTIAKCKEKKDCDDGDKCTRNKCKKNGMCVNKKIKKKQCCMTHGDCVNKFANGKCTVFQCKKDKGLCKKKGKRLDCKNAKKCKKGIC